MSPVDEPSLWRAITMRRVLVGWRAFITWIVMLGVVCASAAARPGFVDDPYRQIDLMPVEVDAAVVLRSPGTAVDSDARFEHPLHSIVSWMRETGMFTQTFASWGGLAARLGMSEHEAARALLGGRVVIALAGVEGEGLGAVLGALDDGWLIVSEVTGETAELLRSRLGAVPRRIASGYAVYAIDTGRTGMAIVPEGDVWRVVLAPTANSGVLDRCLSRLRARNDPDVNDPPLGLMPMPTRTPADSARRLGVNPGESWFGLLWTRLGGEDTERTKPGSDARAGDERVAGVVTLAGDRGHYEARFAVGERYRHGAPVGALDAVEGGALLAAAVAGEPFRGASTLKIGLTPERGKADETGPVRFGSGFSLEVHGSGDADSGQLTTVLSGHAETVDGFAVRIDRTMGAMIAGDRAPEHHGRFPQAVRVHRVGPVAGGSGGRIAWCMQPSVDGRSGVLAMALGDDAADLPTLARRARSRWLDTDALRLGVGAETGSDAVSVGRARPAALLEATGLENDPIAGILRGIDRAVWDLRQRGDVMRGQVEIELLPRPARLGAE